MFVLFAKHLRSFFHHILKYSLMAVLVMCMLMTTACNNVPDESNSSLDSSSTDGSSSNSAPSDDEAVSSLDSLSGELSANANFDVEKVIETVADQPNDCASINNPVKGYADKEAEEKRNQILNSKNTAEIYKITGTTYYVSALGDNSNNGKSESTPFASVDAFDTIKLESGDAVLFERGYVYRNARSINCISGVTYGSYGKGSKPAIYMSPKNYGSIELWQPTNKKNVWVTEFPHSAVCSVVVDYGEYVGYRKVKGLQELNRNYAFYHNEDSGYVYMYLDAGNPGKIHKNIEIVPTGAHFVISDGFSDIVIDNLCLKYAGNLGINAGCVDNVTITNCEMGYIGGSQHAGGTNRYGNAVQFWQGGTNLTVSNNWIYQTFDSAVTWQGKTRGGSTIYKNIYFNDNLLEYNNCDIEFFDGVGSSVENFTMNNNIMRFTCMGWGSRLDDGGIRGIEGTIRATTPNIDYMKNISILNNIFDSPQRAVINWTTTPEQVKNYTFSGNKICITESYRMEGTEGVIIVDLRADSSDEQRLYATNISELQAVLDARLGKGKNTAVWIE